MATHKFSRSQWDQIQNLSQRAQQSIFVTEEGREVEVTDDEEYSLEWDAEKVTLAVGKPKGTEEE